MSTYLDNKEKLDTSLKRLEVDHPFDLQQAKQIIKDLHRPKPSIYYIDFSVSLIVAWTSFIIWYQSFGQSWLGFAALLVSVIAFYRTFLFVHEISHFRPAQIPYLNFFWNLFCGIPNLLPSFAYKGVHVEHHRKKNYGTREDGEYYAFGLKPPSLIFSYLAQTLFASLIMVFRFMVVTPISFLHPKLRRLIDERFSALAIDPNFKRKVPKGSLRFEWMVQEIACCVFAWTVFALVWFGVLSSFIYVAWYVMGFCVLLINAFRTLAAHRYLNPYSSCTTTEQLLDSINVIGSRFVTEIWAPVGLRYHALHHLFPTIPYHNLGIAHRRLMRELPHHSPYRLTVEKNLWNALVKLWRSSLSHSV